MTAHRGRLCCIHMKYSVQIDPAFHRCNNCYWPPKYPNLFIRLSELPPDIFKDMFKLSEHCSAVH